MPRTALSFLGTGRYSETHYTWNDDSKETKFMPVALQALFEPDELLVAETPGARDKHGAALRDACDFTSVDVPEATDASDWWKMFNALTEAVPEGTTLLLDITHGFRSQPFLALAVVLFLRATKNVEVERIVYGAFEARSEDNRTPVFDLTAFLDLVDGAVATQIFTSYGDARPLRDTFQAMTAQDVTASPSEPTGSTAALQTMGGQMGRLTTALALNRPHEALQLSDALIDQLKDSMTEATDVPEARPLRRLLVAATRHFAPLGQAAGDPFSPEGFTAQAAMLRFYLETEQYLQAFTFAREALVTWTCIAEAFDPIMEGTRGDDDTDPAGRKGAIHRLAQMAYGGETTTDTDETLAALWRDVRHHRNDIAHPDFNADASGSGRLIAEAQRTLRDVVTFLDAHPPRPPDEASA